MAWLPADRFHEAQNLCKQRRSNRVTTAEFEAKMQDIIFPFLPRRPGEDDQVEIRLAKPKIQVVRP